MTRPVEEFELSALIDEELDPTRAAEVRAAIEQDPALHEQFLRLLQADRAWARAARSAQFRPAVACQPAAPAASRAHAWVITALALAMVTGRVIPKVQPVDLGAAILIQGLILAGLIAAVVWISGQAIPQEYSHAPTSV